MVALRSENPNCSRGLNYQLIDSSKQNQIEGTLRVMTTSEDQLPKLQKSNIYVYEIINKN
jgi:hypothetical protein